MVLALVWVLARSTSVYLSGAFWRKIDSVPSAPLEK
jgi:hypothetical protein